MSLTLAFPVRLNPAGGFEMVEQNSPEEIIGSAQMQLLCPENHRPLYPGYGRPPVSHTNVRVDRAGLLRTALLRDEPRLPSVMATEQIDQLAHEALVTIGVVRG